MREERELRTRSSVERVKPVYTSAAHAACRNDSTRMHFFVRTSVAHRRKCQSLSVGCRLASDRATAAEFIAGVVQTPIGTWIWPV
jgi:hypothetical protein